MTSYVRAPLNFAAHQRATVGDQKISFTSFDHLGWMKCDGRAVSRDTFALLFNVIGTTFGSGDGSTTFNLPDFRGCVPGMAGRPSFNQTRNPDTYARGDTTGEQYHALTVPELPTHNHGTQTLTSQPATNYELTSTVGNHNHGGVTGEGGFATTPVSVNNLTTQLDVADNGSPGHTHPISGDGEHHHTLTSQGQNVQHNTMQPSLFSGNMYIFSGRMYSGLGTYPYSAFTDLA